MLNVPYGTAVEFAPKTQYHKRKGIFERSTTLSDMPARYNVLSLFSGCGGLDLGFAQAGAESLDLEVCEDGKRQPKGKFFEILWANDIYSPSCKTHSTNFGAELYEKPEQPYKGIPRLFQGDIAKILFENAVDREKIDVILGGFPCQDFSVIRGVDKRLGVEVKRGRLYCHFVRALATLQPAIFVAENVKGLVSANGGRAYKWILQDFGNLNIRWNEIEAESIDQSFEKEPVSSTKLEGYRIIFSGVLNFKNFGVPQARERLIIIGLRKDLIHCLDNMVSFELAFQKKLKQGKGNLSLFPLSPIESLKGDTLSNLQNYYERLFSGLSERIEEINSARKLEYCQKIWPKYKRDIWQDYFWFNQNGNGNGKHQLVFAINRELITKERLIEKEHKKILLELGFYKKPVDEIGELEDKSNAILSEQQSVKDRMSHIPFGENHEFVRDTKYHVSGLMSNIYRRIHPLRPSPTVIARGGGGTWGYHYAQDRQKLTNRERARLQTFPDSFIFEGNPGEVRRQIGEAVPPLAGKFIAESIVKLLDKLDFS